MSNVGDLSTAFGIGNYMDQEAIPMRDNVTGRLAPNESADLTEKGEQVYLSPIPTTITEGALDHIRQMQGEIERLRKLLDETVRERETYNGYHQAAVMEIDRLREQLGKAKAALKAVTKAYVDAPGWASPTPTTELVWKMYTTARDALSDDLGKI